MADNYKNHSEEENTLSGARSFVMVLLIGVLCFYALLSNTNNKGQSLPMIAGKGCAVVMTGSMEPTLPVDSLIFVNKSNDYKEGDVVVIQDYYNLVVHRIVFIDEDVVITKGDANNSEDEPMPISSIRGEVVGHIPYIGAGVRIMKTPLGSLMLIGVVLLFWSLSNRQGNNNAVDEDEENCEERESDSL